MVDGLFKDAKKMSLLHKILYKPKKTSQTNACEVFQLTLKLHLE